MVINYIVKNVIKNRYVITVIYYNLLQLLGTILEYIIVSTVVGCLKYKLLKAKTPQMYVFFVTSQFLHTKI